MNFELKYAKIVPDVWNALDEIPREGWVRRGVKNPESVQKHSTSCRDLVRELVIHLAEFSNSDILEILDILEVHDYPEKINGDEVIVTNDPEEKKRLKAEKFKREYAAMLEITKPLGSKGKEMFSLWLRFEKGEDKNSIFAKEIDKYQSIEQAFFYEDNWKKVFAQDFINYYRNDIVHPVLKMRIMAIEKVCKKKKISSRCLQKV